MPPDVHQPGGDRIAPIGQLHRQSFDFAAIVFDLAMHRFGKVQAVTRGSDGGSVTNFGLYCDSMRHGIF